MWFRKVYYRTIKVEHLRQHLIRQRHPTLRYYLHAGRQHPHPKEHHLIDAKRRAQQSDEEHRHPDLQTRQVYIEEY